MNGVYITESNGHLHEEYKSGVDIKIQGQIKAFNAQGLNCTCHCIHPRMLSKWEKIKRRLIFLGDGMDWRITEEMKSADYLYIRKPFAFTFHFLNFLKRMRKLNPICSIIIEIPTYPYDKEFSEYWHRWPLLWEDRFCRKRLKAYVDRMAVLGDWSSLFGIPTLQIFNGMDLEKVTIKKQNPDSTINICCMARFEYWHGADRLLAGLENYQKAGVPSNIHVYLAGDGSEIKELKKQTKESGLNNMVTFCGLLNRQEMDKLYDKCDIAVASLGGFRKNVSVSSELKSREYLAKGIPFFYAGEIDVFMNEPVNFCLQIPANNTPVDMEEILMFYKNLIQRQTKQELSSQIRAYAERNIGWEKALEPVIHWIKNDKE